MSSPALDSLLAAQPNWIAGDGSDLAARRSAGLEQLRLQGLPTLRDEDWRYTSLKILEKQRLQPIHQSDVVSNETLESTFLSDLSGPRLVFVDGCLVPELSATQNLPDGVRIGELTDTVTADVSLCAALGSCLPAQGHGFIPLNEAYLGKGACIHIGRNVHLEQPVQLYYINSGTVAGAAVLPRNLLVLEEGAEAVVLERYIGLGDAVSFTDVQTEVCLGANAGLQHYLLQEETQAAFHIGGLYVRQYQDSRLVSHVIHLGGRLVRRDLDVRLCGTGATCELNGLYVGTGRQHIDNHTVVHHEQPQGTSKQLYKGMLDDRSRAVFHGRVVVSEGASKTDAQQNNRNLLLSKFAEVDSKPQLEIYNDDVKCSHGAAVGQLDTDALFYLRSRAIDKALARRILTVAFAREVVEKIPLPALRKHITEQLESSLLRGLH
ncbi:MAG TPA: Fe-S cluster assembly protein SufD [Gammaproteobacteria bacterium]|nr:Fe-S cluster assembly protein SufD [Gammaproteobacteria bacterium]